MRLGPAALALALLAQSATALCAARDARAEAELLARSGEAKVRLAIIRRRAGVSSGADLAEAMGSLAEASRLDAANLRAMGALGIARIESHLRKPDRAAFEAAREPLERLFRVTRGWADPATREILRGVSEYLDAEFASFSQEAGGDVGEAASWWRRWREEAVVPDAAGHAGSELADFVAQLRGSPHAWLREKAADVLGASGVRRADMTEALAHAARSDRAPWVRISAAEALVRLSPPGWETLVAPSLRDDPSPQVRRSIALALGGASPRLLRDDTYRALSDAMSDTPVVASAAALTLGEHGAHGTLLPALRSSSALVRLGAAWGAKGSREESVRQELRLLLDDADPRVRLAAARALMPEDAARVAIEALTSSGAPMGGIIPAEHRAVGEAASDILARPADD